MRSLRIAIPFCFGVSCLGASLPDEATPWTKSFLETRVAASIDRYGMATHGHTYAPSPHTQYDGSVLLTSAPMVDWEFDVGVFGRSWQTRKFFGRAERQLLSDLTGSPVALTAVVQGSTSGHERSCRPVFFEMAKNSVEAGFGIGRHLIIRKTAYTQLFSYILGGTGSARARWARAEVGLQQVFSRRHYIRISYEWLTSFGHAERFQGIGTIRTFVNGVGLSYAYRFDDGLEARCSYVYRHMHRGGLQAASGLRISLSLPFSL
jgi:hypothetical protein